VSKKVKCRGFAEKRQEVSHDVGSVNESLNSENSGTVNRAGARLVRPTCNTDSCQSHTNLHHTHAYCNAGTNRCIAEHVSESPANCDLRACAKGGVNNCCDVELPTFENLPNQNSSVRLHAL
jgi:hypothetical protein